MIRSLIGAALLAAAALSGCSSLDSNDETVGWSAQRIYGEAKDAQAERNWQKAIKLLEKLEARYPYGRYAQQAQLEVAYCQYKDQERASAIAAADRFIKLYPNHPNVDYAWYLKGLVNFNTMEGALSWLTTPDMSDRDPKLLRYLAGRGIRPGARIRVEAREPFDGAIVLTVGRERQTIAPGAAANVWVEPDGKKPRRS